MSFTITIPAFNFFTFGDGDWLRYGINTVLIASKFVNGVGNITFGVITLMQPKTVFTLLGRYTPPANLGWNFLVPDFTNFWLFFTSNYFSNVYGLAIVTLISVLQILTGVANIVTIPFSLLHAADFFNE